MNWHGLMLTLHLFFDMLWVGSTIAMAVLLLGPSKTAKIGQEKGNAALELYQKVANPSFSGAFFLGCLLLYQRPTYYFVDTKFMHGKLLFAVIVVVLTHVLGAKAKKQSESGTENSSSIKVLLALLLLGAFLTSYFGVVKPF